MGVLLKAGSLSLIYEKGTLRKIMLGNTEVIRMIYAAVRDRNWSTIDGEIVYENIQKHVDAFNIKLIIKYNYGDINFIATYKIIGEGNSIQLEMNGKTITSFYKNRIGFCVLHPIKECSGKPCKIIHPDESSDIYKFPKHISPSQPMMNIKAMIWQPDNNTECRINFYGDIFEMEDQRNWTDASYKTYCTPLEKPFPSLITQNTTIKQTIDFRIKHKTKKLPTPKDQPLSFSWDDSKRIPIPSLGCCMSSREQILTTNEIEALKQLNINHYRAELKLNTNQWISVLEKAVNECEKLECALFLVVYFSTNDEDELERLIKELDNYRITAKYFLIVRENHLSDDNLTQKVRNKLKQIYPDAMIGSGVNAYFAELNRNRPKSKESDFVSLTISPQVHAFDDQSIIENLEAQKDVVESAKKLFNDKQIYISPVTLKQRFNVVATSEEETKPDELPSQVDIRQRDSFTAAWTLGSIKNLAEAGAKLITYYETVGWRGVIQGDTPPEHQNIFQAKQSEIFPVYHLLKEFSEYQEMFVSNVSNELKFTGVVIKNKNSLKVLISSLSKRPITIKIEEPIAKHEMKTLGNYNSIELHSNIIALEPYETIIITEKN